MSNVLLVLGMVLVTWGIRSAPFFIANLRLSPALLNFLNCIPPAVLAALIAEPILTPVVTERSALQPELLAALVCVIAGILRAPMLLTVIVGMASFWGLNSFL